MRKALLALFCFALVGLLCACRCEHTWQEANCLEAKKCTACGVTEGEALGHSFQDASCTESKLCTICGLKEGAPLGHSFREATCTEPQTCSLCALTQGAVLPHSFQEASCTAPQTCSSCGCTEGEALGHNYLEATCQVPKTCKTCGQSDGEKISHAYVYYTCKYCGAIDPSATFANPKLHFVSRDYSSEYFSSTGFHRVMISFGSPMGTGSSDWFLNLEDTAFGNPDNYVEKNGKKYYYDGGSAGHCPSWSYSLTDTHIIVYDNGTIIGKFLLNTNGSILCVYALRYFSLGLVYY